MYFPSRLAYNEVMNDFLTEFNKKQQENADTGTIIRPFTHCPSLLRLAEKQELIYKYQYLEESVESLAIYYRVTPTRVNEWLKEKNITRKTLDNEADLEAFETHVNTLYKSIQIRMLGLVALNTATSWQSLATAESDLLASLVQAAKVVSEHSHPDPKMISSLATTHDKLVARHAMIQSGIDNAGNVLENIKEQLGWEIEVTHVESQSKNKRTEDESTMEEDNE